MILTLNKVETSVLLLHMATMRNSVKKGFKKAYGSKEGKELLKRFDEVKEQLEKEIGALTQEEVEKVSLEDRTDFHFNVNEFDMIYTFVMWYKPELQKLLKAAGKIKEEDQEQLNTLQGVIDQMEEVKLQYA
ncbi:hypothetical protein IHV09_21940 [Fictibacillus sp. 23RED33]|uniref:hypothetical protein n=1 Tax=Fictibacillus sp. 23RED33 TaxID=2745879 RepID=UPI0018CD210D|nr:hypothetical protein [Fictibacillus sp. 23RED33]MBH0176221.1 hypothetical protein [Fictibacillus sp. 23RED33]